MLVIARATLSLVVLAALAAAPASAHRATGLARGFVSTVERVEPALAGVDVRVLDADDRLSLTNESGREILILGYQDEPYLRIGPDGVFRNERSPATYLNRDRYARVAVPARAAPDAPPEWRRIRREPIWAWHDHRIQWMSPEAPPEVRAAPKVGRRIFGWAVPGRVEGRRFEITGRLEYAPPGEGRSVGVLAVVAGSALAAAAGLAFLVVRTRLREPEARPGK